MKRLKYYILNMKPTCDNYEEVYEGAMYETFIDKDPVLHNHAMYWDGEIGYEITKTNRLELSKPTIFIHIPLKNLKVEKVSVPALDYIFRAFIPYINELNIQNDNRSRTAKENGYYYIYEPNHKVLTRNVISASNIPQKYYVNTSKNNVKPIDGGKDVPNYLCATIMIQVQLPLGKHKKAIQMLTKDLPEAVNLFIEEFQNDKLKEAVELYEKQERIRKWLKQNGYMAFIANGSILPRDHDGEEPLKTAIPFESTKEDEVEIEGLHGMVFQAGVTVITGGGYSGKSTLLDAVSAGIYHHIKGDGREFVITNEDTMKISAEDGRCIRNTNLSAFIKWIPNGIPTNFSSKHASGSTSQAANVIEAVNWGVNFILMDEDKSATNFMIQDPVMKNIIKKDPITPYVERVQELYQKKKVSTMLVIGGSSEYLKVADRIYMMEDYKIHTITKDAKELQEKYYCNVETSNIDITKEADFSNSDEIDANYLTTYPNESSTELLQVSDLGFILIGDEKIDIRMIHDIATIPQLNAIAFLIRKLTQRINPMERYQKYSVQKLFVNEVEEKIINRKEEVEKLLQTIEIEGLESSYSTFFTDCMRWMDLPRKYEILAVLSRMQFQNKENGINKKQ